MRVLRIIAGVVIAALGAASIEWAIFTTIPVIERIQNIIEPRLRNFIEAFQNYLQYGGELRIYADAVSRDMNNLIIRPVMEITKILALGWMILHKGANYATNRDTLIMDEIDAFFTRKNSRLR